jgi:hypothetical protein
MALSDHERKLLAEMEAALEQEDPRLLSTLTGKARTKQGSRALLGFSTLLVGLFVLVSGLVAKQTIVGVLAFLISLAGVLLIITNIPARSGGAQSGKGRKRFGFGSNLEQRWDRRNNNEF